MKRTNKIFALLLAVLMVIAIIPMSAITAFADATGDAPTEVRLSYDYMEMEVGDRYECTINMVPTTANPSLVNLTSSDPTVVFASGKELIALKEGEVTITATAINGVTDTMKVKVFAELLINDQAKQTKVIRFDDGGSGTLYWYRVGVGNKVPKPADPTKEGYVFCGWYEDNMLGTGFTNLWLFDSETVEETDKDTIELYPKFVPEADFVPTTDLSFVIDGEETGEKTLDIKLKSTYPIQVNQTPNNATINVASWTVSDPNVLSITPVSFDGDYSTMASIECFKPGTVTITATIGTLTKSCTITVVDVTVTDKIVFELNGYLPGGNVSDISVSGPEHTLDIKDFKLYDGVTEVTGKIGDKKTYILEFSFSVDSSLYDFLDTLTKENLKLGELTATSWVRSGASGGKVEFELPALGYIEIDNLDIYITPPIAGQMPATTITDTSGQVTATQIWWVPSSQFVEGETYYLQITLKANPGYIFPVIDSSNYNDIKTGYKINGVEVEDFSYTPGQRAQTITPFCGFTALPAHTHTYTNSVLQKDDTYHWLECDAADCPDKFGSIKDKVEHSESTPATCTAKATCACGLEIGELGAHNFATDAWKEEVPATCVATGTKAHKDCSVCHKHFAADGVTEITDLTIAIDTTNHDMATEWTKTADGHYYACKRTGCEHHGEVYAHNPDKAAATETESVNCTVCGHIITPALGHTTHTPKSEWKSDANNHWHECTGCEGQELDKAAHVDADTNGKCDTCGKDMPTTPGTDTPGTDTPGTDDPNAGNTEDPTDDNDGLPTGAIVGIVIGSVVVVGVGGFALFWFVIKKKTWAEFLAIFKKG